MALAKILLVDHEQGDYGTLKEGLAKHGYEIHLAAQDTQALALAGAHRYKAALVSLDVGTDTDLLPKLHAEQPGLPLIFILPGRDCGLFSAPILDVATLMIGKPLLLESVRLILDRTVELITLRDRIRQDRHAWCDALPTEAPGQPIEANAPQPLKRLDVVLASKLRYIIPNLEAVGGGALHRAVLSYVERLLLTIVWEACRGNQVRASEVLGINRNTLRKKIRDLKITLPKGEA